MGEGVWLTGHWWLGAGGCWNVRKIGWVGSGICSFSSMIGKVHPSKHFARGRWRRWSWSNFIPDKVGCSRLVVRHWWFIHPNWLWEMKEQKCWTLWWLSKRNTSFRVHHLHTNYKCQNWTWWRIISPKTIWIFCFKRVLPAKNIRRERSQEIATTTWEKVWMVAAF